MSVGEGSELRIKNLKASNSNMGIASKDSSIVNLDNASVENVSICLAAYKKKQDTHRMAEANKAFSHFRF